MLSITPGNPTFMTTDNIQIQLIDTPKLRIDTLSESPGQMIDPLDLSEFTAGPLPTSLSLVSTSLDGDIRPFSATFTVRNSVTDYAWTSKVAWYSREQYSAAIPSSDPTYTQLPADLPERIQALALDVTAGHNTPYAKATALGAAPQDPVYLCIRR